MEEDLKTPFKERKTVEIKLSVVYDKIKDKKMEIYKKHSKFFNINLFILGTHANFAWFILGSSAQNIANNFNYGNLALAFQL